MQLYSQKPQNDSLYQKILDRRENTMASMSSRRKFTLSKRPYMKASSNGNLRGMGSARKNTPTLKKYSTKNHLKNSVVLKTMQIPHLGVFSPKKITTSKSKNMARISIGNSKGGFNGSIVSSRTPVLNKIHPGSFSKKTPRKLFSIKKKVYYTKKC